MIDTKMTRSRLTLLIQNLTLSFIDGAHPNFSLINVLSEFRPLTPSGPGMWWIGKFLLSKLNTISAISFILTISSLPMLTGSLKSDFVSLNHHYTLRSLDPTKFLIRSQYCLILEHYLKTPSTHSSMNVKVFNQLTLLFTSSNLACYVHFRLQFRAVQKKKRFGLT